MWLTFRAHEWSGWLHRIQLNLWYLTLLITSRHPGCRNVIRWQKSWRSPDRISCYSRIQTNCWMIFFFCFVPFKVWRRRLVLRHKLTMHTAFAREDNSAPAAITSLLVSKWVLWFLWTDQSIDRENDRPNSRPNERSTDWTKTGTSDFSIDRRTNEWTNGKRRTINDERWIKNDQQWTTNKRTNEGKAEKRTDHLINKRRNEQASERTTERTNEPTDYEGSDWRIFKTSFNTARYFFGSCCCQWSCKGFSHPSLWIKYRSFSTFYRDHRKLFVGDFRGRIYSWSVTDAAGMDRSCW